MTCGEKSGKKYSSQATLIFMPCTTENPCDLFKATAATAKLFDHHCMSSETKVPRDQTLVIHLRYMGIFSMNLTNYIAVVFYAD